MGQQGGQFVAVLGRQIRQATVDGVLKPLEVLVVAAVRVVIRLHRVRLTRSAIQA